MQAVMGLIATGWDGDIAWPSAAAWPWVALIGCAGLVAHTCLTNALAVAPATVVTPMDFLRLPVIAIVGMAVYDEPLDVCVITSYSIHYTKLYDSPNPTRNASS